MEALVNVTDYPDHSFTVELTNIPTLTGNLTRNLSIQMRQAANANSSMVGTAWKTETYVLTLVFLITTILKNAQNKISPWKSSSTALLLHVLAANHHKKLCIS